MSDAIDLNQPPDSDEPAEPALLLPIGSAGERSGG